MTTNNLYENGSEWQKWDLHVHTPASLVQGYGGDTPEAWEKFISDLEALPPEFKVIGINDYLFLDGYKKVLDYKANGRLANISLFLPVLEFRLNEFIGVEFGKLLRPNLHVIFSEELTPGDIESQFLSRLTAHYKTDSSHEFNQVVTRKSLEEFGVQIIKSVPAKESGKFNTPIIEGFNNLNLSLGDIKTALNNTKLEKRHFLALGKTEWDQLKWTESAIASKKSLIHSVDLVFVAAESPVAWESARNALINNNVNSRLLDCSDSHYLSTSAQKDRVGNCNTWIKANPTFEGLRQVVVDFDQRAKIQERNPIDHRSDASIIDFIEYTQNGVSNRVVFNPSLNVIIGSRANGKSQLIKHITYSVSPQIHDEHDVRSIYGMSDFSVTWGDSKKDAGDASSPKCVYYIPQGFISSLAYDGEPESKTRNKFLLDLLSRNDKFSNAQSIHAARISGNTAQIQSDIQEIVRIYGEIGSIEKMLQRIGSKSDIDVELAKKTQAQNDLAQAAKLVQSDVDDFNDKTKTQQGLLVTKRILEGDMAILGAFSSRGAISVRDLEGLSEKRKGVIAESLKIGAEAMGGIIAGAIVEIDQELKLTESEIKKIAQEVAPLKLKLDASAAVQDIAKEIKELNERAAQIVQLNTRKQEYESQYSSVLNNVIELYSDFENAIKESYRAVADQFNSFRTLKISLNFNSSGLGDSVEEVVNKKDGEGKDYVSEDLTKHQLHDLVDGIVREKVLLLKKPGSTKAVALGTILQNRWEINFLQSIQTRDGGLFEHMSGGQRAIALLELVFGLSNEKYPVLIDQPEDDLDVKGITEDLVEFLKTEKVDRQVFVVTHNANLLVGSDAEEVISAKMEKVGDVSDFVYSSGAIENLKIQEIIVSTLEGGKPALRKRFEKLSQSFYQIKVPTSSHSLSK